MTINLFEVLTLKKKISLLLLILFVILFFFCFKPTGHTVLKYKTYSEIPESDGIHTWLPDFFPNQSKNISFTANIEDDRFLVMFSLNDADAPDFEKKLITPASVKGEEYIKT
ncbi:hypothetical protein [Buttiauxella izardii]|uniref:hypothetical protein n=1 Tax=Buttiauxella izardii TaxID=82991 RepID=UPI0011C21C99|nr:hypothetical protein [Buttiauxella izardii]